ncbi:MAG TPA: hypothetical protein VIL06_06065 [Coriobacteriia bacterium]
MRSSSHPTIAGQRGGTVARGQRSRNGCAGRDGGSCLKSVVAGHIWIVQAGVARQRFRLRPASPVRGQTRE